jgi:hypothetical protein
MMQRIAEPHVDADVDELLARWVTAGLVSPDQAEHILRWEGSPGPRRVTASAPAVRAGERTSLLTEALGYLGGVLVAVAVVLLGARFWPDLGFSARCALVGSGAGLLLTAGAAVPQTGPPARGEGPAHRLRAALWLASTGAMAALLAMVASDGLDWSDTTTALFAGAGAAAYGAGLWRLHPSVQAQLGVLVALCVAAGAGAAGLDPGSLGGLGVWGVAMVWALLARGGLIVPARPSILVGAVAAFVGGGIAAGAGPGTALVVVTSLAVVAAAVIWRDLALLGVGALGTLVFLPQVIGRWFGGRPTVIAFVLLVIGAVLVGAAVLTSRRPAPGHAAGPDPTTVAVPPAPGATVAAAVGVAALVTIIVLAIGLT